MKKTCLVLILLGFSIPCCFSQSFQQKAWAAFLKFQPASIIELIAHPENFDGKKIRVFGYLHLMFEDSSLYLSKEQADYGTIRSSIWVTFGKDTKFTVLKKNVRNPIEYLNCRYVFIIGTFNSHSRGHMGAYSGTIENIEDIQQAVRDYDGKRELRQNKKYHVVTLPGDNDE